MATKKTKAPKGRTSKGAIKFATEYWDNVSVGNGKFELSRFAGPTITGYPLPSADGKDLIFETARQNAFDQIASLNDENPRNQDYFKCPNSGKRRFLHLATTDAE